MDTNSNQSERKDENMDNQASKRNWGCLLSIPTIIVGLIVFWPVGIVLGLIRLFKSRTMQLRKNPVFWTLIIYHILFIVFIFILGLYGDDPAQKPYEDIQKYVTEENYSAAQQILDDLIQRGETSTQTYLAYADFWEKQKEYDNAVDILIQYYKFISSPDQLDISVINKLLQLEDYASDSKKEEIRTIISEVENARRRDRTTENNRPSSNSSGLTKENQEQTQTDEPSRPEDAANINADKEVKLQEEQQKESEQNEPFNTNLKALDTYYKNLTDVQKEAFKKEYIGKYVEWRVKIYEVNADYIYVLDDGASCDVYLQLSENDKLMSLSKGQYITIKGKLHDISSFFRIWEVRDAVILE